MKLPRALSVMLSVFPLFVLAQETPQVIPLWANGAPGFEDRRHEPELAASYWVKNVHNPSITVFLPPQEKATGAAVIVCPGHAFNMGNRSKLVTIKGWPSRLADWLADSVSTMDNSADTK